MSYGNIVHKLCLWNGPLIIWIRTGQVLLWKYVYLQFVQILLQTHVYLQCIKGWLWSLFIRIKHQRVTLLTCMILAKNYIMKHSIELIYVTLTYPCMQRTVNYTFKTFVSKLVYTHDSVTFMLYYYCTVNDWNHINMLKITNQGMNVIGVLSAID